MSAFNDALTTGAHGSPANAFNTLGKWVEIDLRKFENLGMAGYRQQALRRRQDRIDSACRWFATKWRTRASEIGIQAAARLMRKQGVPCEVAVSILATR